MREVASIGVMTEERWLACRNPKEMLEYLRGKISERKVRLFAVASCRMIWNLLSDKRSRLAVEVAERFADNLAAVAELEAAHEGGKRAWQESNRVSRSGFLDAGYLAAKSAQDAAYNPQTMILPPKGFGRPVKGFSVEPIPARDVYPGYAAESAASARGAEGGARCEYVVQQQMAAQAELLREICGNPFQSYSAPPRWHGTMHRLAKEIYAGEDVGPALELALRQAAHPELADHFGPESRHPKGCWVIDLILGNR